MAPPKRELALTGAGAGAPGRDAAKRLRVGVVTGASGSASASGCWPMPPASPGKRLMRRSMLVVLFLVRKSYTRTTVAESISQLGRMVQGLQAFMMSKLENLEERMEGKLEKLGDKMESISLEVKKLARLHSNRHVDQEPRQEPSRESATESGSNAKNFHLRFLTGLKTPIYTEKNIKSESNSTIRIGIFDGDGNMITEGPLSKVKVEMLVLRGDFCNDGRESWTEEEFNSHIAQGRHGQGFVLGGDCSVWLNNGEASFGGAIRFKEGSSRTRSRMFNVAARVCTDGKTTDRVREAVMMPVTVLDRRNEANEKKHPPKLGDEVYRLEEISKDGKYHRRLQNAEISTVQDFLKALNKDAINLREKVLQMKKVNNSWERMVNHARECSLIDSHQLIAYRNEAANAVLFFNCVYDLVGAEFAGTYVARGNFDAATKALANELKESARDELDSTPFNYVMNGSLPMPVPSRVNSRVSMPTLAPDAALQGSGYQHNDRTNHVTEPSHHNEYAHGDQNTVNAHYNYYQGEGIPPLSEQQPTTSATPPQWDGELLDWLLEGSGEVDIHRHMQVPISMAMGGGSAMEASTSAQNNVLRQQFLPNQFQESMPGMHYPEDVPNPVADSLHEPEPSVYPFPGADYGSF